MSDKPYDGWRGGRGMTEGVLVVVVVSLLLVFEVERATSGGWMKRALLRVVTAGTANRIGLVPVFAISTQTSL